MRVYDLRTPGELAEISGITHTYRILPKESIVLTNTPMIMPGSVWQNTHVQLKIIADRQLAAKYIFIDGSYDPIRFSNRELQENIQKVQEYFPASKVIFLSSRVQHWYDNIPNVLYVPYFIGIAPEHHIVRPRSGRMGCLNRNNSPHRIWLMHNLLKDGLIDAQRDVFSVSFVNVYGVSRCDVANWLGSSKAPYDINYDVDKWPDSMASHPDGFPNDHTTNHPAWNTGIAIVTETEPGYKTMLTEKTWKAIRSSSCWTSYMAEEGYTFLEDIGFQPRLFKKHASFDNISPIVNLCKKIDTEAAALDYYRDQIHAINHNFDWSGGDNIDLYTNLSAPWHNLFLPEFKRRLNSL
jgi:hypothetical protein